MNFTTFQRLAGAAALTVSALVPSWTQAQGLTLPHAQGEATLRSVPKTVAVTDWAIFDNLHALGVEVAAVPGANVPSYLLPLIPQNAEKVGALPEPDLEAIAAVNPDVILIAARSRTSYPTLSKLAPTLDLTVDNNNIIAGISHNLELLGKMFDKEARAAELIAGLNAKVEQARTAVQGQGTGLVIVTNAGKIGVYGPQSRVAWVYKELNMPSVFDSVDDRDHGGDAISFEYLLKTNPDWLFVIDRDAGTGTGNEGAARALLDNELIHQTKFWQNDQIVYLDPQAAYVTMHGHDALHRLLDQVIDRFKTAP